MKYLKQTEPDNCYQTCLACLLELPIDNIPKCAVATTWNWPKLVTWLAYLDLGIIETPYNRALFTPGNLLAIGSGRSPRGNILHAVIVKIDDSDIVFVHDPHPDNTFIKGDLITISILFPINKVNYDLQQL